MSDRRPTSPRADRGARTTRELRVEFGDFQTPPELAREVVECLARSTRAPAAIVEPTCGRGHLLAAAVERWASARVALGVEVQTAHLEAARLRLAAVPSTCDVRLELGDFFALDWRATLAVLPEPILIVGNPPWVTNAAVGRLDGTNLPTKSNASGLAGLAARTGAGNFDVSESMLSTLLDASAGRDVELAFLCKTAVARKILARAWKHDVPLAGAVVRTIDATRWFDATVDACLLHVRLDRSTSSRAGDRACVHARDLASDAGPRFGWRDGGLVADVDAHDRRATLAGPSPLRWRSGIKHDAAAVMELTVDGTELVNGLGERVDVESDLVFPMLKSSQITPGRALVPTRRMLVSQRRTGEDTTALAATAPRAWAYLNRHASRLDGRKSSIYRGRARFALFGVGPYAFAPWKVAISGFYKRLAFTLVPPYQGRPVVLDDTAYFLPCDTRGQAEALAGWLASDAAREFLNARVFWDSKRPVTAELLNGLDLRALARELDRESEWAELFARARMP